MYFSYCVFTHTKCAKTSLDKKKMVLILSVMCYWFSEMYYFCSLQRFVCLLVDVVFCFKKYFSFVGYLLFMKLYYLYILLDLFHLL